MEDTEWTQRIPQNQQWTIEQLIMSDNYSKQFIEKFKRKLDDFSNISKRSNGFLYVQVFGPIKILKGSRRNLWMVYILDGLQIYAFDVLNQYEDTASKCKKTKINYLTRQHFRNYLMVTINRLESQGNKIVVYESSKLSLSMIAQNFDLDITFKELLLKHSQSIQNILFIDTYFQQFSQDLKQFYYKKTFNQQFADFEKKKGVNKKLLRLQGSEFEFKDDQDKSYIEQWKYYSQMNKSSGFKANIHRIKLEKLAFHQLKSNQWLIAQIRYLFQKVKFLNKPGQENAKQLFLIKQNEIIESMTQ